MGFDSLGRYSPTHKSWDHVGNMIPVVEHSEGVRPHGEFKPAAWLPVKFFDKYYEEYFVVMPGKVLAFDNQGRVCPAQYAANAGGVADPNIVYTTNDVTAGTIDVRTGTPVIAEATFAQSTVTDFMGTGEAMTVSSPVGVAPYAYWQWAGDGSALDDGFNPSGYRQHNHNLQHRVAILCDYVLELPLVPASDGNVTFDSNASETNASNVSTFVAVTDGGETSTGGSLPLAANTVRTPMAFSSATLGVAAVAAKFANQVGSAADISAAGDWAIDLTTGVLSVFSAAEFNDAAGQDLVFTFSYYGTAGVTGASVFAAASGNLKAGDFVVCDAESNLIAAAADDDFKDIVGQVLELENADKDALGMVKTAYNPPLGTDASGSSPGYAGQMDQMPGSATGGVSDKVHYAGAADLVVRINLVSR